LINCRNRTSNPDLRTKITVNATIDVIMKLSFGNMISEMNIFNICKQPRDDNDLQEVDFNEKLVHDQFQTTSSETEIDKSDDLQMVYFQEESKPSN